MIGHVFNIGFEVKSLLLYWSAAGRDAESGSRHGSRRRRQGEIVLRARARKAVRWRHGGRVLVQVVMYPPGGRTSSVTQVLTAEFLRAPRLRMAARRHAADDGVDRFAVTLQVLPVGYHGRVFTNFVQSKKKTENDDLKCMSKRYTTASIKRKTFRLPRFPTFFS